MSRDERKRENRKALTSSREEYRRSTIVGLDACVAKLRANLASAEKANATLVAEIATLKAAQS